MAHVFSREFSLSSVVYTFLIFLFFTSYAEKTDFIIFSFDRPLQLYALLESTYEHVDGLGDIFVIYRASEDSFAYGYEQVKSAFPDTYYVQQSKNAREDFKPLTLQALHASNAPYVMFGVDDMIVKDRVDCEHACKMLEQYDAYGCYLRLGTHLDYCYPVKKAQNVPPLKKIEGGYLWIFNQAHYDWGYPHTVDMTIYRKEDIKNDFQMMSYVNPNSLEATWAGLARGNVLMRKGVCYELSKVVNLPLNRVQDTCKNHHMNFMTPLELLMHFLENKKIDIQALWQIKNKSAHMDYAPAFVER